MRIRIISDLHLEFGPVDLPPATADVVVLAGDIDLREKGLAWAKRAFPHDRVLYVAGNHEYYGAAYPRLLEKIRAEAAGSNVEVLERNAVQVDGVTFLGCTLWTDFDLEGDRDGAMAAAEAGMSDYRRIRLSPNFRRLRPMDTAGFHAGSRRWLERTLRGARSGKLVVVTHHAPCRRSVDPADRPDPLAPCYASSLEPLVWAFGPDVWIHGHVHRACDFPLGNTRVACNPRGYPGEPSGFDPARIVEV